MLARAAESLFWLARYMDRADYVARLLEVAGHMNAVRVDADRTSEWESAIVAAGCETYFKSHPVADEATVVDYLAFSRDNPSSIANCEGGQQRICVASAATTRCSPRRSSTRHMSVW